MLPENESTPINEKKTSEQRMITISEETLLRMVKPDYFKFTNYVEWRQDNDSKRKHIKFIKIMYALVVIVLAATIIILASYCLLNQTAAAALLGSLVGIAGNEFKNQQFK
ncbi:MAG: hypothetical protein IPO83_12295 [Chitinophagaceae bacterium]|nr:hypothetical protein [Chitinophagaceae bacterium]